MGKRELVASLCLSSWCLVIVVWLFLAMPRVCLQFVIVVFPDYSHLLFLVFLRVAVLHRLHFTLIHMADSLLFIFFVTPPLGLQCVILPFPGHTYLLFQQGSNQSEQ